MKPLVQFLAISPKGRIVQAFDSLPLATDYLARQRAKGVKLELYEETVTRRLVCERRAKLKGVA